MEQLCQALLSLYGFEAVPMDLVWAADFQKTIWALKWPDTIVVQLFHS